MKFCSECGHKVIQKIPEMDDRLRFTCEKCETIHYQNPNVVVGTLSVWREKVLLCKRAIEPQKGLWTLPAGFLENGETTLAGAERETWEEACASICNAEVYRLFDLPFIDQVYLFYRAELKDGKHSPGMESQETSLYAEEDIPWDDLAFPVIHEVLKEYFEDRRHGQYPVRYGLPRYKLKT